MIQILVTVVSNLLSDIIMPVVKLYPYITTGVYYK